MAACLEALDQLDHLRDMPGCGTDYIRPDDVQTVIILEESFCIELGDIPDAFSSLAGALGHLVLTLVSVSGEVSDIGYIHDVLDFITGMAKHALECVLENVCPEVADMGIVIDRRSAAVETHETFGNGLELLNGSGHGIVKIDLHVLSEYDRNISNIINLVNIILMWLNQSVRHDSGAARKQLSEEHNGYSDTELRKFIRQVSGI